MSDIKKVNVAENSFLELWRSYCDKKSECESLVEENAQLKADNAELVELLDKLINPENCKKDIIHIIGSAESLLNQLKEPNNE